MRLSGVAEHLLWAKELVRIGWSVGVVPVPLPAANGGLCGIALLMEVRHPE